MESAAKRAQRHRRLAIYAVASLASFGALCVFANDGLVELAVDLARYPFSQHYALDLLSLLLYLHEPNRDVAIERGVLEALSAMPDDDVDLAKRALGVLAALCSSERYQDRIAKQWRPALLILSKISNESVALVACSALARLAQNDKNPTYVLTKEHMLPLLTLSMTGNRAQQTDAARAIYALSPFGALMDYETRQTVVEATNMLVLSRYVEPQAVALRTLSRLARFDGWRPLIAEQGCLYNIMLNINGRLSDRSRKWALKSLVYFADDRNYRLRVGEGSLSSVIKTVIKNPYDEVKLPAVTILAILASNDSYRNRILGTAVLDKIVGYLRSPNDKLRTQSAHLLIHLAATDESRKRAADLQAAEAIVDLFNQATTDNARLYSAAAMGQLALTSSVRRRLGSSGAVESIERYLRDPAPDGSSAARSHCFAALVQLSLDDDLREKMKSSSLLGILLSSSEASEREEQLWALRALLHMSLDKDGKAKLRDLGCDKVLHRVRRSKVPEVKLLAEEVLSSLVTNM